MRMFRKITQWMDEVSESLRTISRKLDSPPAAAEKCTDQDTRPRIDRIDLLEGRVAYLEEKLRELEKRPAPPAREPDASSGPVPQAEAADPFAPLFGEEEEDDLPRENAPAFHHEETAIAHVPFWVPKSADMSVPANAGGLPALKVPLGAVSSEETFAISLDNQAKCMITGEKCIPATAVICRNLLRQNTKDQVRILMLNFSPAESQLFLPDTSPYLIMRTEKGTPFTDMDLFLQSEANKRRVLFSEHHAGGYRDYCAKAPEDPAAPLLPYMILFVRNPGELPAEERRNLIADVRIMRSAGIALVCVCDQAPEDAEFISNIHAEVRTKGFYGYYKDNWKQQQFYLPLDIAKGSFR